VTGRGSGDGRLLLAVDGGNSKTDVLLTDGEGQVLAHVRGPSSAPIHHGLEGAMDALDVLIRRALADAAAGGAEPARPVVGVFALAGADLPFEEEQLLEACRGRGWVERAVVRNDAFALLRAGTDRGWGVAVVCGAGINGVGVGPDGGVVRFPALGTISGDWGGGYDVGLAAVGTWASCRRAGWSSCRRSSSTPPARVTGSPPGSSCGSPTRSSPWRPPRSAGWG
jgi:N-acetylglucosamine kinase-like BadF-type ATPase